MWIEGSNVKPEEPVVLPVVEHSVLRCLLLKIGRDLPKPRDLRYRNTRRRPDPGSKARGQCCSLPFWTKRAQMRNGGCQSNRSSEDERGRSRQDIARILRRQQREADNQRGDPDRHVSRLSSPTHAQKTCAQTSESDHQGGSAGHIRERHPIEGP